MADLIPGLHISSRRDLFAMVAPEDEAAQLQRELIHATRAAKRQDAAVLDVFHASGRPMAPSAVWAATSNAGHRWPLTSIRRAISNLADAGALVKLDALVDGPFGKPEHQWSLPMGQGELFGRAA